MIKSLCDLPSPILNQLLLRIGLCGLSLVAGGGMLLLLGRFSLTLSFLLGALLLALSAAHLYTIVSQNRYLMLKGTVLKLERTALRRRPKALLVAVDGKALRVLLHKRHRALVSGATVTLYVADTAPLHEWRGLHQLGAYLALAVE